jgi:hypothetical protein
MYIHIQTYNGTHKLRCLYLFSFPCCAQLCPLTAESDAITHILATIVRIPITSDEVRLFLHSKMALYVSPATVGQPQTQSASSSSPSSNAATTTTAAQGVLQPLQQYRQSQQQQQHHFRVNAPPTAVGEKAAAEQAPGGSNTHTAFNTNSNTNAAGNSTTHSNASSITSSTTTTTKNTSSNSSNVNTTAFGCTSDANNPFATLPRSQHPQSSQSFSTQHMPNPSYLPSQLQYQQFQHNQFQHHNHPAQK